MTRHASYQWRLRDVMADHGMFSTTELVPLLKERGIDLSASQVHRLVTGVPERFSLPLLAALCDIFGTDTATLIVTSAQNMAPRKAVAGDSPVIDLATVRPTRARIRPDA
jgi:Cro/C1-type HTH DNA-binding domain